MPASDALGLVNERTRHFATAPGRQAPAPPNQSLSGMSPNRRRGATLLAAGVIAAVAGCGGGGGGGAGGNGNVRPDTPAPVRTVAHHPPPVDNSMRSASVRTIAQGLEYRGGDGLLQLGP